MRVGPGGLLLDGWWWALPTLPEYRCVLFAFNSLLLVHFELESTGSLALYRNGWKAASIPGMHFFIALIGILFCEFFAFISPFGYWANIAKDRDVDQQPAIYAFLFWVLFIATGCLSLFYKG